MEDQAVIRRRRRQLIRLIIMTASAAVANIVLSYCLPGDAKYPDRNRGSKYIRELMLYDTRMFDTLRMNGEVFRLLVHWIKRNTGLRPSRKGMAIEEQLGIFLFLVGQGSGYRLAAETFYKSLATIKHVFHRVLTALSKLYKAFVVLPTKDTQHTTYWRRNGKFWPWFEDCIGALDGTHIDAHVPTASQPPYRNRKGQLSQNVLAVCEATG